MPAVMPEVGGSGSLATGHSVGRDINAEVTGSQARLSLSTRIPPGRLSKLWPSGPETGCPDITQ